jgi:hypothetical protein
MMVFELWESESGHAFFERASNAEAYRIQVQQYLTDDSEAKHVWTVEAATYNQAMQALYDRKGWGEYRIIEADLGESES